MSERTTTLTLTEVQARALLACAEVGWEGLGDDVGEVPAPDALTEAAGAAVAALRDALRPRPVVLRCACGGQRFRAKARVRADAIAFVLLDPTGALVPGADVEVDVVDAVSEVVTSHSHSCEACGADPIDAPDHAHDAMPAQCYRCERYAVDADDAAAFIESVADESDPESGPSASDIVDIVLCPACASERA